MVRSQTIAFFLLLLLIPHPSWGQRPQQASEGIEVHVRIILAGGRAAMSQLRVELLSGSGVPIAETTARGAGQARFVGLRPGSYIVRVSGLDVEEATSGRFTISTMDQMHLEYVQVKLREPANADYPPAAGPATVSTVDLNVPPKAGKEFEKGSQALASQHWDEARKRFEKAIEIYPQYASAYNNLGVVLMNAGRRAEGRAAFEKAITLNASFARAYVNLARIYSLERNYSETTRLLEKALANDPLNVEALMLLANAQLLGGRLDDAISTARKAHGVPHQQYAVIHYVCAQALQAKNLAAEAAAEYRLFLEEAPESKYAEKARAALKNLEAPKP